MSSKQPPPPPPGPPPISNMPPTQPQAPPSSHTGDDSVSGIVEQSYREGMEVLGTPRGSTEDQETEDNSPAYPCLATHFCIIGVPPYMGGSRSHATGKEEEEEVHAQTLRVFRGNENVGEVPESVPLVRHMT